MAEGRRGADRTRLSVLVAVFAVVVVVALVVTLRRAGLVRSTEAKTTIAYTPHGLPPLEVDRLEAVAGAPEGYGRNPFTFGALPTPTPRPVTPVPTREQVRPTPRPTPTPRMAVGADGKLKPPPPPFDREYLGYFGPLRLQVAAFRKSGGGDGEAGIEVAVVGDVLDNVFIVREIGLESVQIGFVGYDLSEDTRVPLAEK